MMTRTDEPLSAFLAGDGESPAALAATAEEIARIGRRKRFDTQKFMQLGQCPFVLAAEVFMSQDAAGMTVFEDLVRLENLSHLGQQTEEVLARVAPFDPLWRVLDAISLARKMDADRIPQVKNKAARARKLIAGVPQLRKEFLHLVVNDKRYLVGLFVLPSVNAEDRTASPDRTQRNAVIEHVLIDREETRMVMQGGGNKVRSASRLAINTDNRLGRNLAPAQ
jgi:hypothetical protein